MSKRTTYTEISPLPPNVTRELVLDFLHNHVEMIDLNPLIKERHPIPVPADAPSDERRCAWYSLTDEISYLPGGIATGDVSYTAAFSDLPNGIQTHCRAPLGVDIRSRWTLNGTLPGEPPERTEIGIGAPVKGLYIREDVEVRCNVLMASFVKKTTKRAHMTLVTTLARKAGKAATDLAATSAGFSPALFAAASPPAPAPPGVRSHRGASVDSAQGYTPPRYSPRPSSLNPSHNTSNSSTSTTATTGRGHAHSLSEGTASNGPHRSGHGQCASVGGSPAGTPRRSLSPALGVAWPATADSSYHPAQRHYSPKMVPTPPPQQQQQPRRSHESDNPDVPALFRPPQAPLGSPPVMGGDWHRALLDSASVPALFRPPQAPLPSPPVSGGRPRSSSDRSACGRPDDVPVLFRPPQAPLPSPPMSGGLPPLSGHGGGGGDTPALFRPPQALLGSPRPAAGDKHRAYSPPPPTYTPNLMMAPSACSAGNTPAAVAPPSPVSSIGIEDFVTVAPKVSSSDETVAISGLGVRTNTGNGGINPFPNPLRISKSNSNASSIYSSIRLVPQEDEEEDCSPKSARPKSGSFFYPEMNPYEFRDGDDDEADSLSAAVDKAARDAAAAAETASFTSSVASTPSSPLARQPLFAELEGSEARPEASSPRLMMMRNSVQYDAHPMALRPGSLGASPANSPLALHEFH